MSLERAAMKGKLAELRDEERRLKFKIEGAATAIRAGLNTTLTPPAELNVPVLDTQWDELKAAWTELTVIEADISRLEKELR